MVTTKRCTGKYADTVITICTKEKMDISVNTFVDQIPELVNKI